MRRIILSLLVMAVMSGCCWDCDDDSCQESSDAMPYATYEVERALVICDIPESTETVIFDTDDLDDFEGYEWRGPEMTHIYWHTDNNTSPYDMLFNSGDSIASEDIDDLTAWTMTGDNRYIYILDNVSYYGAYCDFIAYYQLISDEFEEEYFPFLLEP